MCIRDRAHTAEPWTTVAHGALSGAGTLLVVSGGLDVGMGAATHIGLVVPLGWRGLLDGGLLGHAGHSDATFQPVEARVGAASVHVGAGKQDALSLIHI